jgi:hypothetical protein
VPHTERGEAIARQAGEVGAPARLAIGARSMPKARLIARQRLTAECGEHVSADLEGVGSDAGAQPCVQVVRLA